MRERKQWDIVALYPAPCPFAHIGQDKWKCITVKIKCWNVLELVLQGPVPWLNGPITIMIYTFEHVWDLLRFSFPLVVSNPPWVIVSTGLRLWPTIQHDAQSHTFFSTSMSESHSQISVGFHWLSSLGIYDSAQRHPKSLTFLWAVNTLSERK